MALDREDFASTVDEYLDFLYAVLSCAVSTFFSGFTRECLILSIP